VGIILREERQDKIVELIKEKRNLKITEISQILNVSDMTVHRDIKPLLDEGFIMKTFGGITLVREEPGKAQNMNECNMCHCQINPRFAFKLILKEDKIEDTCCAHCGIIRHFQLGEKVVQSLSYDFLIGTTVSSYLAWFVFDSSIKVGCCMPQILTFGNKEYADKFVQAFGGEVLDFQETLDKICNKQVRGKR
jgi:DeoR family transcriptional regulator, copper-sensing transcriptional repressor